jgi:Cu-processing system permease protein
VSDGLGIAALVMRQEILLAARSRWLQAFAVAFGLLATVVAASGRALSGAHAVRFARTSVSLTYLVVLVVPLAALVMGVLELVPEGGSAEMLFSQPVSRRIILLGKYLGLLAALAAAELIGFGAAGLAIFWRAGTLGATGYALLLLGTILLTADFLAIAAFLASGAAGRARSLTLALITWVTLVVLVDVAALAIATVLPSADASLLLIASVLANPAAAIRTGTLLSVEGAAAFGTGSLALLRFAGGPLRAGLMLSFSVTAWLVLPLWAAMHRLARVDF